VATTKARARRHVRSSASPETDTSEVVNCLRRLFKSIHEYSKAMHRRVGLSSPQVWALTIVDAAPGLSLGELALRMFAHPSTVSGVIDRLVDRGAVRRDVDPKDRRGVCLSLTPAGKKLLRSSPPPVQQSLADALRSLAPARLSQLRRSLEEIVERTESHKLEAPFFDIAQ
jgi:MarR family transcriptional regulator, organic hydroperoxide resistance regulator